MNKVIERRMASEVAILVKYNKLHQPSKTSLKSFVEACGVAASNKYRECILLQIGHCLLQLEQDQTTCNALLSPSNIFIRKDRRKHESFDAKKLASIYCLVLTGKHLDEYAERAFVLEDFARSCSDPLTAIDLIENMTKNDFMMEDVLKHPYYWDIHKKVKFICEAFIRFLPQGDNLSENERKEKRLEAVKKYGINDCEGVIPDEGWIEKLELLDVDVESINAQYDSETVSTDVIYDLAFNKSGKPKYDTKSMLDLMNFFRNHHVHFCERDRKVQIAFGDSLEGYLNFYTRRFPGFFGHVYRKMRNGMTHYEVPARYKHLPKIA